jgi:hypothetical protein
MRKRLTGSAAGMAALVFSLMCVLASFSGSGARAQSSPPQTPPQTAAKSQTAPTDLSGVWRRSRRPPDNAKRYTLGDVVNYLTHVEPTKTAWGDAKFKANKPNLGPRAVPLAESNDPVISCFPPSMPRLYFPPTCRSHRPSTSDSAPSDAAAHLYKLRAQNGRIQKASSPGRGSA